MAFCDHCLGQRYDRARVLRTLRQMRRDLGTSRASARAADALAAAIRTIRALDIPHLDPPDLDDGTVIH